MPAHLPTKVVKLHPKSSKSSKSVRTTPSTPVKPSIEGLFDTEESPLLRYAYGMVARREVAEEIVQDGFLKLHQHWEDITTPRAWLYRATRNLCLNHLRKHKRETLTEESDHNPSPNDKPDEQLSRMEAIGTLAGGIAHDFNNILTAILGYTELGLASVPKGSRTQRNLQEVLTAGHRAKHLVLQILAFSRQSGQGKKPTPIHTVIQEALKLLRATIPTSIEIRQSLMTEASVFADSTQLHQVVINLCTNAEYAMRETGGLLAVTLEDVEPVNNKTQAKEISMINILFTPKTHQIVQPDCKTPQYLLFGVIELWVAF